MTTPYKSQFKEDSGDKIFNILSSLNEALTVYQTPSKIIANPENISEIKDLLSELTSLTERLIPSNEANRVKYQ